MPRQKHFEKGMVWDDPKGGYWHTASGDLDAGQSLTPGEQVRRAKAGWGEWYPDLDTAVQASADRSQEYAQTTHPFDQYLDHEMLYRAKALEKLMRVR